MDDEYDDDEYEDDFDGEYDDEYDENFDDDEYDGDFDEDEYDDEFEEDENSYSDALDLEGATRQIELPKRNAKKEEDDFSLDFINLDE